MAKLWDDSGSRMIGRSTGNMSSAANNDNFFTKKARSIENAIGTTLAVPASFVNTALTNAETARTLNDSKTRMDNIAKKYGYNSEDDFYGASIDADENILKKYGFDFDSYDARVDEAVMNNDQKALDDLDAYKLDFIAKNVTGDDANKLRNFTIGSQELRKQATADLNAANNRAKELEDYRKNNYVSKKINQDRGKFAGSAINTLSTAADLTGLTNGPLSNAIQGGIEGIADELEQNGLQNFDWGRAGQNAAIGAASGAAVGAFNKGLDARLAQNGGKLFAGNNLATRAINKAVDFTPREKTLIGQFLGNTGRGAVRGAASGAIGGATGAGLSAALNNQDILSSALQGATQGAQQGAVAGGTMAGANTVLSRTPGVGTTMRQLNQANENWQNSGDNFRERWANTRAQDTWGNRLIDNIKERGVGLSIKDVNGDFELEGGVYPTPQNFTVTDGIRTLDTINGAVGTYSGDGEWNGAKVFYTDGEGIPVGYKVMANENAAPTDDYVGIVNDAGERALIHLMHPSEYDYERVGLATGRTREALAADGLLENSTPSMAQNTEVYDPETELVRTVERNALAKDVNGDGIISAKEGRVVDTPAQKSLAELSDGQYKTVGDMVNDGLDLQTIKSALSKRNYDELVKNVREIANIKNLPYESIDVKSKSDLPVLNREQYYEDTLGKVKGNDYVSYKDVPDYMNQHLSNPKDAAEAHVRGSNDEILRDLFKDDTSTISELYEKYEKLAQGENANEVFTGKNFNDALALGGPEFEQRITTELANNLFGGGRKVNIDSTNSGRQNVLVKNLAMPRDIKNMAINDGTTVAEAETATTPATNVVRTASQPTLETEVYRALGGETEARPIENTDLMYGESALGNRTRRGMLADSLERFGNTLEGAQTNVTRAAEKDLGIQSTGKVIENVRKKTGIVNLETQAALAKELTGGADSLMDNVQRRALTASETGKPYTIDTGDITRDVDAIVDKYADTNMFGSQTARQRFISNLKQDISNYDSDILSIANRMKANASDLRGKGVVDPPALDKAKAKIYTEVANRLEDASYKAIPKENVEAMFDATISEMRGRAQQAANNGNKDVAKAYTKLADALNAEPRTVKAFRSFKKDFVDISKINELTARAENGAAVQMGRSFGGSLKRFGNTLLQRPVNAALAKAGGAVNDLADRIDTGAPAKVETPTPTSTVETPTTQATTSNPATQLYNAIGRTEGEIQGDKAAEGYLQEAARAIEPVAIDNTASTPSTALYNSVNGSGTATNANGTMASMTSGNYYTNILERALNLAMEANDAAAFGTLYEMYQNAVAEQEKNAESTSQVKLTDKQRQANAAERALNDFETAEHNFAYDVSDIPVIGAIANLGGNEYASKAEALALQIGYMLSGATVNAQEAKNIGMAYIPQPRDNEAVRRSKLAQIRGIISDYQKTYSE